MIPDDYRDLLDNTDDGLFMVLSLTLKNGAPISSPIWFISDPDDTLLIATDPDSLKALSMRARPQVAAILMRSENYTRYMLVRGSATEVDGAPEIWRRIVNKYVGRDPLREETLAAFRIKPERVSAFDYTDDTF